MRILYTCALLIPLAASPIAAQFYYPVSASTRQNFVQLADGGPSTQNWITTIALANPDPVNAADVRLTFFNDSGQNLLIDFGHGPAATLVLQVPAGGSTIAYSTGAPSTTSTGWARVAANLPVYGTVMYQARKDGTPFWDFAAPGVGGTFFYASQAVYSSGVAVLNPNSSTTIHLRVGVADPAGNPAGVYDVTLPGNGHTSFVLGDKIPGLSRDFKGTMSIRPTDSTPSSFSAWTTYEREGFLSPLPAGSMPFPPVTTRKASDAMALAQIASVALARTLGAALYNTSPTTVAQYVMQQSLVIEERGSLGASYQTSDNTLHITRALFQTLDGSDPALAFLVGHYVARGVLNRTGIPPSGVAAMADVSLASDTASLAGLFSAGFDPGGLTDFYGRLGMAYRLGLTIESSLQVEFGAQDQFIARQNGIWNKILGECAGATAMKQICQQVHDYWHPDYPTTVP